MMGQFTAVFWNGHFGNGLSGMIPIPVRSTMRRQGPVVWQNTEEEDLVNNNNNDNLKFIFYLFISFFYFLLIALGTAFPRDL